MSREKTLTVTLATSGVLAGLAWEWPGRLIRHGAGRDRVAAEGWSVCWRPGSRGWSGRRQDGCGCQLWVTHVTETALGPLVLAALGVGDG